MKEWHSEKALMFFSPIWVVKHLSGLGEVENTLTQA